jgi:hypothetical protein
VTAVRKREITGWLQAWSDGDGPSLERLTEVVYKELRRRARGYKGKIGTLLDQVYLNLVNADDVDERQRCQFRSLAAVLIRRILVDQKPPRRSAVQMDAQLRELADVAPRQALAMELRHFGAMTEQEISLALRVPVRTVRRDWQLAEAWLSGDAGHVPGGGRIENRKRGRHDKA